jgi:hypothetical protein
MFPKSKKSDDSRILLGNRYARSLRDPRVTNATHPPASEPRGSSNAPRGALGSRDRRANRLPSCAKPGVSSEPPTARPQALTYFPEPSAQPTNRPEPHLCASQNSVCAGIVARAAIFSEGGRDTFSKAPTASNSVICLRIELPLGPEPAWYSGADSRTTRALSSPRGTVSDWNFRTSSFYGTNFVLMSSNAQQRVA